MLTHKNGLLPLFTNGGLSYQSQPTSSSARLPTARKLYPLSHRNIICRNNAQWKLIIKRISYRNNWQKSITDSLLAVLDITYMSRQQNLVSRDHYFEGTLPIAALLGRYIFYVPQMPAVKLNQSSERFQTLPSLVSKYGPRFKCGLGARYPRALSPRLRASLGLSEQLWKLHIHSRDSDDVERPL